MTEEIEKKESEKKCDIDDILCQMEILGHLKGMKGILGEEQFSGRFPELEGLVEKLTGRIGEQESSLKEALESCGLAGAEIPPLADQEMTERESQEEELEEATE